MIPQRTFTPYNAQATLHMSSALWGLLLPITVHGRVSDIWRSYFAQALMWRAGLHLAMAQPWVVQKRNAHNYMGDFEAESNLYYQSGALLEFLSASFRGTEKSIPHLMEHVYIDMYEHGILQLKDVALAQAWLKDLSGLEYVFPDVIA